MTKHLKVEMKLPAVESREVRVERAKAEMLLRRMMSELPREGNGSLTSSYLSTVRSYAKSAIRELRRVRGRANVRPQTLNVVFVATHRSLNGISYSYRPQDHRSRVLHYLRDNVRAVRREQRPREQVAVDPYRGIPPRGVLHRPGLYVVAATLRKSRIVFDPKRPRSNDNHVGVELEFVSPVDAQTLGAKLTEAGLGSYVHLHEDGSIRADPARPGYATEISVLAKQSEIPDVIPRLTAVLAAHKCYVNQTCGMHVHLDMRNRDRKHAFAQLVRSQPVLYAMVPKSRKENRYCRPTRGAELHTKHLHGERYHGINARALEEHNTLEVRLHSGTLSPVKIVNWVQLLVAIVDGKPMKYAARTVRRLAMQLSLPETLKNYMLERCALFNAPPAENVHPHAAIDESALTAAA